MHTRSLFCFVRFLCLLGFSCGLSSGCCAGGVINTTNITENSTHFPSGTLFIARHKPEGTLLWATAHTLYNSRTGTVFSFPKSGFVSKRIVWSADQKRLLVQGGAGDDSWFPYGNEVYVLEASSLRMIRHVATSVAWWQGSDYAYVEEEEPCRVVFSTDKRSRMPDNLRILAADPQTGIVLGAVCLPHKPYEYRLVLGKLSAQGRWQHLRTLGQTFFDGGSSGVPRVFGIASKRRVLVGSPHGGVYETLDLAERGQIKALFAQVKGGWLANERGPFAAGNVLFGIVRPPNTSDQPRNKPLLYLLSATTSALHSLEANAEFVYYDPVREAIGVGVRNPAEVAIRFIPMRLR